MAQYGPWDVDVQNPISDDPLNDGLVSWWLGLPGQVGGGTLFDIKGGNHGTLAASTARPTWAAGLNGFGALSYDGGDHVVTSGSNGTLSAITIAAALRPTFASSDTNRRGVFMWTTGTPGAGNPNRHRIIRLSGGYYYDGNSTFAKSFAPTFAANEWHHLIFTASASASAWYFNGRLASSSTGGAFNALGVAPTYLGWDIENAAWKWSGLIGDVRVYPSALSAPEVSALYADWLAGYPRTLRRWRRRGLLASLPQGGAAVYTLSCDPGSLALTGGAASLPRSLSLPAAAGSLALAGGAAALERAALLAADPGSLALTGGDASLPRGLHLPAAAGSLALAGGDASPLALRLLDAESGPLELAGGDAALSLGVRLACDPGGLALTGGDAGLTRAALLGADPGALELTGGVAGLERSLRISAGPGALALTGGDAGLNASVVLVAESGSLALAGGDAALLRSLQLDAGPGALGLTGGNATLSTLGNYTLDADPGALTLTGGTLSFERSLALPAAPGPLAITGGDATLAAAVTLTAQGGVLALAGGAAEFFRATSLGAAPGVLSLTGGDASLTRALVVIAAGGSLAVSGGPATLSYSNAPYGGRVLAAVALDAADFAAVALAAPDFAALDLASPAFVTMVLGLATQQDYSCFRGEAVRIPFTGTGLDAKDLVFQLTDKAGGAVTRDSAGDDITLAEGSGVTVSSSTAGYVDLTPTHTGITPRAYAYTVSDRTNDRVEAHGAFTIRPPAVA